MISFFRPHPRNPTVYLMWRHRSVLRFEWADVVTGLVMLVGCGLILTLVVMAGAGR